MRTSWISHLAPALTLSLGVALGATSCGGSGSGSNGDFFVDSISVPQDAVWQINRPIQVRFNRAVNFNTVSLNSINIRKVGGANAVGEFFLADAQTVVFQPLCPTNVDFSDAALEPGGALYELTIVGNDSGLGFTVESSDGTVLETSVQRTFSTPTSLDPPVLFFDPVVGAPRPLIRGRAGVSLTELAATYVEVSRDVSPATRLYFEDTGSGVVLRNAMGQEVDLPLNLFSQDDTQIAVVLYVNQPVNPVVGDPSFGAVRFEYQASIGNWVEVPIQSELVANCTSTGAVMRIVPEGVLAPQALTRVVMTTSFADLSDETNQAALTDFAVAVAAPGPVLGALSDEIFVPFILPTNSAQSPSLEDVTAALPYPPAEWGGGRLAPGFDFDGDGGPLGDFDVQVAAGQSVIWNTSSQLLTGGPGFAPTQQITAFNGVFNVDDFRVGAGAILSFEGPNPVQILATGTVDIQGTILVNGSKNIGVVVLGTTNVPEEGASGQCGGGKGGNGSPLTNAHSTNGGTGIGPYNLQDFGGTGGEAGWSTSPAMNGENRRGAGGGGGVFGPDQYNAAGTFVEELYVGLNAEPGFSGAMNLNAMGAVLGAFGANNPLNMESPPNGGMVGESPFKDADPNNNFFGRQVDPMTNEVVFGELTTTWAGSGGGGGGDASNVSAGGIYPEPFINAGDEKGGGGGGGAGAITILAIESIMFGLNGQIQCRGGHGGGGESTNFVNRIGAAGGGGAGGHVILQTAATIDFSAKTAGLNGIPAILATGGQGGAGADDLGGAQLTGEVSPALDACPPVVSNCPTGQVVGAGGDGGPGLVQLHTPTGTIGAGGDIVTPPSGAGLEDYVFPTPIDPLLPQFGRNSSSRSVWIRLGEGGFDALLPTTPIPPTFSFEGTDPLTGSILVNGSKVLSLPPIVPAQVLQNVSTGLPYIAADGFTLVMSGAGVADELKGNPSLMKEYLIDFDPAGTVGVNTTRFAVVSSVYDLAQDLFSLTVTMAGQPLTSGGAVGVTDVRVRPTFFRVEGASGLDAIPTSVDIQISFEAAPEDPLTGLPDEANSSGMQTDITLLNAPAMGGATYEFIRFEVFFDVDKNGTGISVDQTGAALDYLRLPFQY